MKDNVPSMENVGNSAKGITDSISGSFSNLKDSMQNGLDDFSKSSTVDGSAEFLNANGLIAKFVFVILVLIVFLFLLKLGVYILGYFLNPSKQPILIPGTLDGGKLKKVYQDPHKNSSKLIMRSNDQNKGIEYTWNVWLHLHDTVDATKLSNIFVKGDESFDSATGQNLLNGPGLYLKNADTNGNYVLEVRIDTMNSGASPEKITIQNIPLNKWVNVTLRLQNKLLDVYVNGIVTKRLNLTSIPKQNYNDVTVHGNNGYKGTTSNLRYYDYALNVFEINNIVLAGPNLSVFQSSDYANSGSFSFMSNQWYSQGL